MSNFSTPQELFDFMMRNRERISEQLRKNMENFPLALYDLSTYGWYFGYGSSYGEVLNYWKKLNNGEIEVFQNEIQLDIENNLDFIESRIVNLNQHRAEIFKEAFKNHREGRYYSAIVLLLTQVDGMTNERFGVHLIKTKNKAVTFEKRADDKEKVRDFFNNQLIGVLTGYHILFSKATAINDSYQNEKDYPTFLNRHNILHGIDVKFGNRANSFRTISYLNFVNDFICFNLIESEPRKLL